MIDQEILESLGFKNVKSPFTRRFEWVIGEEDVEFAVMKFKKQPIVYYNIDKQMAKTSRGEFCIISRKCEEPEELLKFLEAIKFLFNLTEENFPKSDDYS